MGLGANNPAAKNTAQGIYTGNGAATQSITGLGFKPTIFLIWEQQQTWCYGYKLTQNGVNAGYWAWSASIQGYNDNLIISLDDNGFTVGNRIFDGGSDNFNFNGRLFSWAAFA